MEDPPQGQQHRDLTYMYIKQNESKLGLEWVCLLSFDAYPKNFKISPSRGGECCQIRWGVVHKILVFPIKNLKWKTHHKVNYTVTSHTCT